MATKNKNETPAAENQGEGNRKAAAKYNEGATEFAHSGKVDKAAEDAEEALEGPEQAELNSAEEKGKSHAKH